MPRAAAHPLPFVPRGLSREARARRGTPLAATLLLWAANARREAARGTERDLFGKKDEAR